MEVDERELAILTLACRQADTVASLEAAVKRDGVMIPGAKGQRRLNATVTELRNGRLALTKLLGELEGVEDRRARYLSELVAIAPDGEELRGTGIVAGRIAAEPRGSEGFGYDPIFIPDGEERTVAELGDAWKARNAHRARSAHALREVVDRHRRLA